MRFSANFLSMLALLAFAGWSLAAGDPSLSTGGNFAPFVLLLKPSLQMSPMPGWMKAPATVQKEAAMVEVPIPALWASPAVEFYALTVVFQDCGDGGPSVEWRAPSGTTTTISPGLGELGTALGLNARTILLPDSLTHDGGALLVSYYAKFEGLLSLAVRPARADRLAVIGGHTAPVLVDEALRVFEPEEVDGLRRPPVSGDVRRGAVVEADLSAPIEPLESDLEFVVPTEGAVEGSMVLLDVLGLDPEARIEVRVNSILVGTLNFPPLRLDDPALVPDNLGRLTFAGWRKGSLFIPARLWLPGDNSIVLTLKRSDAEAGRPVFVRNSSLHLRFGTEAAASPAPPDLSLPDPLVPDPAEPPLPEIVTSNR